MTVFTRTEVVHAKQFLGGRKSALEIVRWVSASGGTAEWFLVHKTVDNGGKVTVVVDQDQIHINRPERDPKKPNANMAYPTDWVVRRPDGVFEAMTNEEFKSEFDES